MNYDLLELEKNYEVKLDSTQKDVLSDLTKFIKGDEPTICLNAPAGCGKSLILSMLYDILTNNGYYCAFIAPTNKAKLLLQKGDVLKEALTIHSLLNLRPNVDIMDFDANQLNFQPPKKSHTSPQFDVLLVDECSMINDALYEVLCSKYKNKKIIFCGDQAQLAPVKQKGKSKAFSSRILFLTKIYRQPESKLYKVLEYLRHKPLYHFKNVSDDNGNITVCNNILDMIDRYSYLFKIGEDFRDHNLVKMVTYTNNRINALNQIIRKKLYSTDDEYHERELLVGYDTSNCSSEHIENSQDYVVEKVKKGNINIKGLNVKIIGYNLTLDDGHRKFNVKVISRHNPPYVFSKLAEFLETKRQKAVKSKDSFDWRVFFSLYDYFLTPVDLTWDNRVIKRKSIDYGYCISAHKSQSSSYSIVIIDMENLWRCQNKEELRQLQYVACSRTTSDLIIYQRGDCSSE